MRAHDHNFVVIAPMMMKFGTSILHNGNKKIRDGTTITSL